MTVGTQVMMSSPNFYRLEIAYSELHHYNTAPNPPIEVRSGFYHFADTPGNVYELNPNYIAVGPNDFS